MAKEYSVVWQIFSKDSDTVQEIHAKGDISLPFFVDGGKLNKLRNQESFKVDEFDLLKGLLVCYFASPPMTVTHKIKPYFKGMLENLLERFLNLYHYSSREQLILDIATQLKAENGDLPSYNALRAGFELFPRSDEIKQEMHRLSLYLETKEHKDEK